MGEAVPSDDTALHPGRHCTHPGQYSFATISYDQRRLSERTLHCRDPCGQVEQRAHHYATAAADSKQSLRARQSLLVSGLLIRDTVLTQGDTELQSTRIVPSGDPYCLSHSRQPRLTSLEHFAVLLRPLRSATSTGVHTTMNHRMILFEISTFG